MKGFCKALAGCTITILALSATAQAGYDPYYMHGTQQVWTTPVPASANNGQQQQPASDALSGYESFVYDRNSDPAHPAYVAPRARDARPNGSYINLGTGTGVDLGLQVSNYRYQEHVQADQEFMHLSGATFGLTVDGTKSFTSGFFIGGNLRLAYGSHDYTGGDVNTLTGASIPSTHSGEDDFLAETRLTGGYDFSFQDVFGDHGDFDVSPYAGLGFRYLNNDGTGTDSNGVSGYSRDSHYLYFPIGVTPRMRVTDMSRLSLNLEYDRLLYGWQVSKLSDTGSGLTDLRNSQHDGYGLRGSLMYEWSHWGIGPFFNYWNINQSDTACDNLICGVEPHNQTLEYGAQAKYRF